MIYLRNKDILEEIHKSKNSYSSYLTSTDKDYDIILPNIEKINIRSVAQAKRNRAVKIAKENHAIAVEENTNKKKKPRLIDFQVNWKKIAKSDLVFRIMSFEHIPLQHGRVKTPKSIADHYEKLPFPPYQHFRFKFYMFTMTEFISKPIIDFCYQNIQTFYLYLTKKSPAEKVTLSYYLNDFFLI